MYIVKIYENRISLFTNSATIDIIKSVKRKGLIMKVNAITGTNFSGLNNSVKFKGSEEKTSNNNISDVIRSNAVRVPVIVLLAANPATLNSSIPAKPIEGNRIEVAQTKSDPEIDEATFTDFPAVREAQQSDAPFGWKSLSTLYKVVSSAPATASYHKCDMVFAAEKQKGYDYSKDVSNVFIITRGFTPPKSAYVKPEEVRELVYHNTGDDNDFYAVKVFGPMIDSKGNNIGVYTDEEPIDIDTADRLVNFLNNSTNLNNETKITYSETSSPHCMDRKNERYEKFF